MAVYNLSKMAAGTQPKVLDKGLISLLSTAALAVALALNDTLPICNIEADPGIASAFGPSIMGVAMDCDQLDTNGAPTLKLDVGDATTATRYISQSTIAQTGGYQAPNVGGWLGFQPFSGSFNNYTTVSLQLYTPQVKVHTGPATWQNGTIRVKVEYSYDA